MASAPKPAKKVGKAKTSPSTKRLEAKKTGAEGKDKAEKSKGGRPTAKTPEMLKIICEGIATGKSSRAMCIEVGISQPTLWKWISEDAEFSKQYTRAKELCADFHAEGLIELSDEKPEVKIQDGKIFIDPQFSQTQRLRFDARKWYASKLAPKKYGDRTLLSGDEDSPLKVEVTRIERVIIDPGHTKD